MKQHLKGGLGDKLNPKDVDQHQLSMGIKVEMEHTKDAQIAKEIALDHLAEDPHYYTKLKKAKLESKGMTLNELKQLIKEELIQTMGLNGLVEKKPSSGLSKSRKSTVAKKAHAGKDIGKKGKGFKKVAASAAKEYGSKEAGERVAAASMWKNIKREGREKTIAKGAGGLITPGQLKRGASKVNISDAVSSIENSILDNMKKFNPEEGKYFIKELKLRIDELFSAYGK